MRQANHHIHKVEEPYSLESIIWVPDCLYVRFTAEEEKLKFNIFVSVQRPTFLFGNNGLSTKIDYFPADIH